MDYDKREERAYRLHDKEIARCKAEGYNIGWFVDHNDNYISIASKTSHGILVTTVTFDGKKKGTVEHTWRDE